MQEQKDPANTQVNNYYWGMSCFGPLGTERRAATGIWGFIFLTTGAFWLAANIIDIEDWGKWCASLILIGLGIWYLSGSMSHRDE